MPLNPENTNNRSMERQQRLKEAKRGRNRRRRKMVLERRKEEELRITSGEATLDEIKNERLKRHLNSQKEKKIHVLKIALKGDLKSCENQECRDQILAKYTVDMTKISEVCV